VLPNWFLRGFTKLKSRQTFIFYGTYHYFLSLFLNYAVISIFLIRRLYMIGMFAPTQTNSAWIMDYSNGTQHSWNTEIIMLCLHNYIAQNSLKQPTNFWFLFLAPHYNFLPCSLLLSSSASLLTIWVHSKMDCYRQSSWAATGDVVSNAVVWMVGITGSVKFVCAAGGLSMVMPTERKYSMAI